jgi:ferredoxin
MRRRSRGHSRGLQWGGGGEARGIPDSQRRWWSWNSVPGPVSAPPIAVVGTDLCIGCGQCASVCPAGAISVGPEGKAVVDESLCRGCAACVEACPVGAVQMSAGAGAGARRKAKND